MLLKNIPSTFLDSDVVFDALSNREPFNAQAKEIYKLVDVGRIRIVISSSSLANLIYLSYDLYKIDRADEKLTALMEMSQLIHADKSVVIQALQSPFKDKEDALQYYTALSNGVDYFITRNLKDYTNAVDQLPVFSPHQFLKMVSEGA